MKIIDRLRQYIIKKYGDIDYGSSRKVSGRESIKASSKKNQTK